MPELAACLEEYLPELSTNSNATERHGNLIAKLNLGNLSDYQCNATAKPTKDFGGLLASEI